MDRREFFTRGASKAAQVITKHATEKARENASHWIRPPFSIDELDFLLACSRCGDCIDACPHDIIFPLSSKLGVKVFSTPAMDLINQGCHLCEDWPCVRACEKDALKLPEISEDKKDLKKNDLDNSKTKKPLPKISTVSINESTCLPYNGPECGACRVCPVEGAMIWNKEKPSINMALCTGCALCREACILEPKAIRVFSKYKLSD